MPRADLAEAAERKAVQADALTIGTTRGKGQKRLRYGSSKNLSERVPLTDCGMSRL
jgi:hypothetical protein